MSYELYEDTDGDWRWRLTAGADTIADSSEGYGSKRTAREAISRVQSEAGEAAIAENGTKRSWKRKLAMKLGVMVMVYALTRLVRRLRSGRE